MPETGNSTGGIDINLAAHANLKPLDETPLNGGGGISGTALSLEEQAKLVQQQLNGGVTSIIDNELIEDRAITIMPSPRRSAMRAMNERTMEPRVERIGASISAKNALMQDGYMLVKYFPALVGESGTSPNFTKKVLSWLENISVPITDNVYGRTFDISFRYDSIEAKNTFTAKRVRLEKAYDGSAKGDASKRKIALNAYISELMTLERERAHYGMPVKLEDFVIYLHCLYYPDVAKDPTFLSIYSNVRMYIKDVEKEKKQKDALQANKRKAMQNYLNAFNNKELWKEIIVLCCAAKDINYRKLEAKGETEVESYISKFMQDEPEQFNKFFNDPYRELKTLIERGIAGGHLKRGDINQRITTAAGDDVGSNMTEAIAYFRDPLNIAKKKALETQLSI
jgi:hypothetical protein